MDIYVSYKNGQFGYKSVVVPREGEIIIYEQPNDHTTQYFRVISVAYYTTGEYNEVHINAKLSKEEKTDG